MLKYLRIAVTALSLTASVLLIALWVRSQWWQDRIGIPVTDRYGILIDSWPGAFHIRTRSGKYIKHSRNWSERPKPWMRQVWAPIYYLTRAYIPYWVAVLVAGTLAAIPWIRYSLRTLLIAMTLVAVGLGVIAIAR